MKSSLAYHPKLLYLPSNTEQDGAILTLSKIKTAPSYTVKKQFSLWAYFFTA